MFVQGDSAIPKRAPRLGPRDRYRRHHRDHYRAECATLRAGFAVLAMTTGRNCGRYRAAARNLSSGEQIIITARPAVAVRVRFTAL